MQVAIVSDRVELVDAAALLVPVDGALCRLGGAAASALRAAILPDERADELDYVAEELARMRPLQHPAARLIDGVARWGHLVISAAYPHDVDGVTFSPEACARMIRAALPVAVAVIADHALESLAATLIGTAYRMPADLAVRAFTDGLAGAAHSNVIVRWSLPDPAHRALAETACTRLGLSILR